MRALVRATAPDQPLQVSFDWSMQDRDFKFAGKGVVRMQGPYHGRLDLFGPQDIQLLRATLIDDSLAYVTAANRVPIPPAAFLWAVLGVFRTPLDGAPAALKTDGGNLDFTYEQGSNHWHFKTDSTNLRSVEWLGDDGGKRTVELTGPFRFGRPGKAVYRDWREFRELTFNVTAVDKVEPFAPEIWNVSNR